VDQETKGQERRLVVVTGGSSGIGLACADRFRRDDADVRVADVQDREHPVDISDEAAVEAFFAGLPSAPAVLVNAAGIGLGAHILDLDLATWRKVFAVNLDGAFLCLRAAARRMAAAGGGVIVNVTSVNDRVPMRTHAAYCSAKAALAMLTRVAALDLGASNIRVVAVAPGVIDTPLVTAALSIPQVRAAMQERTALGRRDGRTDRRREPGRVPGVGPRRVDHRRDRDRGRRAVAARLPGHCCHRGRRAVDGERGRLLIKIESCCCRHGALSCVKEAGFDLDLAGGQYMYV